MNAPPTDVRSDKNIVVVPMCFERFTWGFHSLLYSQPHSEWEFTERRWFWTAEKDWCLKEWCVKQKTLHSFIWLECSVWLGFRLHRFGSPERRQAVWHPDVSATGKPYHPIFRVSVCLQFFLSFFFSLLLLHWEDLQSVALFPSNQIVSM